jgi:hypothetical protein
MAQAPRTPDLEAQRTAMKQLGFLVGEWSGEASVLRGPGHLVQPTQTESAQFRLDGLLLVIEGVGRSKSDGKLALQAIGLVSFGDETGTYGMRAFNDGGWLETEIKLADGRNSISWEGALGEFKTTSVLRINENGEWTERGLGGCRQRELLRRPGDSPVSGTLLPRRDWHWHSSAAGVAFGSPP